MSKEKKIITYLSMVICFLIVFIYCLSPFAVGLNHGGNNSSFEANLGLKGAQDGFFYTGYSITDSGSVINGSMYKIVKPLVSLAGIFSDYFDIRILSFIYAIILLISVFYLNKYINFGNRVADIVFAVITIFIAFDLSYLLYLNTLYTEGLFYVMFLLAISLYIKLINSKEPQLPTTIIFMLTVILICTLRANLILLVIPFAIMAGYLIFRRKSVAYRVITVLLTIILLVYPFLEFNGFNSSPTDKYNSVFYGILYENSNPEEALKKIGIDEKYSSLAGTNHFSKTEYDINSEEFKGNVTDKISYGKIIKYYITNPDEYLKQYKYVGWNAFETYPKYVGNYTSASGKDSYQMVGGFKLFNVIKAKFIPKNLWFIYLIPVLLIALLISYKKMFNKGYIVLGCSLSIMNLILFNIPMLSSGLVDISRTMAIYNISFDCILIMIIGCMLYISTKRKQEFKDKYGLTQ